jgi:thioredoxin reductase/polyferredoxin
MSIADPPSPQTQPEGGPRAADPDRAPRAPRRRNPLARYVHWLHTQWPAGTVEKLPVVHPDGSTTIPGVYVVGDLAGIPLLKFSSDTGAKAVRKILTNATSQSPITSSQSPILDLVILGAGVSGMAAALEARKHNLRFEILEAAEPFATIINFPRAKPIYTYPTDLTPAGDLQFHATVKESLIDDLHEQTKPIIPRPARAERVTRHGDHLEVHLAPADSSPNPEPQTLNPLRAKAVIVAIGRSGNHRKLNVPGEHLPKVYNRLHDPTDFAGQHVLVVGGGDSALEAAIALAETGSHVTLSYRKPEFSRPKPDNVDRLHQLAHALKPADIGPSRPPSPKSANNTPSPRGASAVGEGWGEGSSRATNDSSLATIEHPASPLTTPAVAGYMAHLRHPGSLTLRLNTTVTRVEPDTVTLTLARTGTPLSIPNQAVFTMLGREAPLDFFRRSNLPVHGDRTPRWWLTLALALAIFTFVYHWKKGGLDPNSVPGLGRIITLGTTFSENKWFPYSFATWLKDVPVFNDPKTLLGTLRVSLGEPGFHYSLAYSLAIVLFGLARIRRRKTPYVTVQTYTLMAIQVVPLFLLPYLILPWIGHQGLFDGGFMKTVADSLFPVASYTEHGREYWRAFGLILAFPLFFWNVFTGEPMWTWLAISFVQTFVIIPLIVYKWGKGAYCGWICSCGALAETLGDAHRHKMPHGPFWNRLNLVGQAFLAFAFLLLVLRSVAWAAPSSFAGRWFDYLFNRLPFLNYVWFVDLLWAGILGVGLYWHFSGRVWCRFACPLAALMHVYARFTRFRILADKKKCISCNVCTSVCHQGIDVMNFANKGLAMQDPQCVRCSACVQSCPTGVLSFGEVDPKTGQILRTDKLQASPVHLVELRHNGKVLA